MSVVGIDFGNDTCFVAVARAGGIETVDNDYSMRATPSFVAFSDRQRVLGVAAKNQVITNMKNTVFNFKRYLGRQFDDPKVQEDIRSVPFELVRRHNGGVGFKLRSHGEEQIFSPEQITAMLFTKLKETTEVAIQAKVHDCVISVPSYFTDVERRALLDAAQIAGFNVLRLLNETAAAALNYGIYKQDLPESDAKPRNVVIVDCGHSAIQVSISAFNKGKLKVLAAASDPYLGGRNFDAALASHFCAEFRSKYHIETESNAKAYMRLLTEVEKLKKQMSANATKLPLNIECFIDEKDVSSSMCRADFEQICAPLFQRIENVLRKCLNDCKLDIQEIHSVEIIGGSTRIPAIKNLIEKIFNKPPSTTLNQEESVSRGCALQCAILSPAFKVRDFSLVDVQPYPIKLIWDETLGEDGSCDVFPQYHPIPFSRVLTFYRKKSVELKAVYTGTVPYPISEIGKFSINFKSDDADPCKIKIKARVDMNGVFKISSATIYEKILVQDPTPESMEAEPPLATTENQETPTDSQNASEAMGDTDASCNANTDENMDENEEKVSKKVQYQPKESNIVVTPFSGLSPAELDEMISSEATLRERDRSEKERLEGKNALEEYVYDLREKLDTELEEFVEGHEKQSLSSTLSTLEDWLYGDGENEKKEVYVNRLQELKVRTEPIKERRAEFLQRPEAFQSLEIALQLARKFVTLYAAKDPKYDHIAPKEMEYVSAAIQETENWLQSSRQKFHQNYQPFMPVPVSVKEIQEQRRSFEMKVNPVMHTPKPKVEPPKEESKKKEDSKTKKPADSANANQNHTEQNPSGDPQAMDVE